MQERAKPKMNVVSLHCLKEKSSISKRQGRKMDPTPHDIRRATGGNAENASAEGNRRGAPRHYKGECLKRKGTFAEDKNML